MHMHAASSSWPHDSLPLILMFTQRNSCIGKWQAEKCKFICLSIKCYIFCGLWFMLHGENDLPIYHHNIMHLITILAAAVLANSPKIHIYLNMKHSWLTWIDTRGGESYLKVGGRLIYGWTTPLTNWARICNSIYKSYKIWLTNIPVFKNAS